ncbi:MAG: hypothetical protein LIP01_08965 [Tannerellaceae bacterium]|nr:hypothetical protein [Tannerellaceae bacterium]
MKNKICLLMICLSALFITAEAKNKNPMDVRYDIECAGAGTTGTYLVSVSIYTKNVKKVSSEDIKKGAVHGVIFRGFGASQGCTAQKALAQTPALEEQKADFFESFFGSGQYLKYASLLNNSYETVRLNKKEYKVKATVSVSKDMLRKDLEAAGILKALTQGF